MDGEHVPEFFEVVALSSREVPYLDLFGLHDGRSRRASNCRTTDSRSHHTTKSG